MKWNIFSTTTNLSKHLEGFVVTCIFCLYFLLASFTNWLLMQICSSHKRSCVIFRWGRPFHPTKIQSFPASIYSCPWGQFLQFVSAKLLCQVTLPNCSAKGQKWQINDRKTGKSGGKTGKYGRNQPKVADTRQKRQKN